MAAFKKISLDGTLSMSHWNPSASMDDDITISPCCFSLWQQPWCFIFESGVNPYTSTGRGANQQVRGHFLCVWIEDISLGKKCFKQEMSPLCRVEFYLAFISKSKSEVSSYPIMTVLLYEVREIPSLPSKVIWRYEEAGKEAKHFLVLAFWPLQCRCR